MKISRRDFLRFCTASSATLAFGPLDLLKLERALANPDGPSVLWLQGSGCTGCSVSLLNRFSSSAPTTAADLLINTIDLAYHPNLMAVAGDAAVAVARQVAAAGNYYLAVEGGIPTAYGGAPCWAWTENGVDITCANAVTSLASRAKAVLAIGTCAAWGGMSAAAPNPTGVKSVSAVIGKPTVNIAGCPPHPDWIVWGVAKALTGSVGTLDAHGRPTALFGRTVHDQCPREDASDATAYGQDNRCLQHLGCYGPVTRAGCPVTKWNAQANWCIDANAHCIGCTEATFPGAPLRFHAEFDD
jgi:hydrogenase small subunit